MKNFYKNSLAAALLVLLTAAMGFAQTTISGKVSDANGPVPGVNIVVKGTVLGTISSQDGSFTLKPTSQPPLTLSISFTGYKTIEVEITGTNTTGLDIKLEEDISVLGEVLVKGDFTTRELLTTPTAVQVVDRLAIQQGSSAEFYEGLGKVNGIQMTSSSLNFPSINTRGFATISNTRFVQLIDGMDASAPLLNFPTGNIVGIGELDMESMELLPGAASALYGPNAFNGLLLMNSKSPFEYQGLSAQFKGGITTSDAQGQSYPYFNYGFRYAKAFNNKFAFKVNFSILDAEDWHSTDYKTDVNRPESTTDLSGTPDFDGLNLYGDEIELNTGVPSIGIIHRTGWKEGDILNNRDAKSTKADIALHYRITDKLELIYNYRYGGGSSVYQGSQKYALRNFTQVFNKIELRSKNFFVRGYMTQTDAGDSYNVGALGSYLNESVKPSQSWAQEYVLAMQGYFLAQGVPGGNPNAARAFADRNRPEVGSDDYNTKLESVRNNFFQKTPPGARFKDDSRLYHAQFNYNLRDVIKFAEIQVGGNFRQYSLFSDGTIFNEAPDDGQNFERVVINEYGFYGQIIKTVADALKFTGSLRYDKNENFDGQVTPKIAVDYTFNKAHNLRASFQTGFRNPDTQAQFIYFNLGTNILLGSAEANASRYGLHNGGAYTEASYRAYRASGGAPNAQGVLTGGNPSLLVEANIPYVKPEQLKAWEIGYRGTFSQRFFVDFTGYYTTYTDFIGGDNYALKNPTTHQGNLVPAGTIYSPYTNSPEDVTSYGLGIGINYKFFKEFILNGSYNYATFDDNTDENSAFRAGFNTPNNKIIVGISNAKLAKNLGFNINFRWQEEFLWQSDFGEAMIPEYGVLDAQVSYMIPSMKTIVKLGGTNLGGGDYRTNFGGPFVGQMYYLSLTFDQLFKKN
ncbi:MAG: TonB-dependent receptor [Cyclobacteriaceae bacterium]|nr:TonB-dependent receptor [Cyclobacteriaceae bacterium]